VNKISNSTYVVFLVNHLHFGNVLIPLQLKPENGFQWRGMRGGGGGAGMQGLCEESMRVPLYPGEATGLAVMGEAPSLPRIPPPPSPPPAPLQWPSLSFQSITQLIKERELRVRLKAAAHRGTHMHAVRKHQPPVTPSSGPERFKCVAGDTETPTAGSAPGDERHTPPHPAHKHTTWPEYVQHLGDDWLLTRVCVCVCVCVVLYF